MQPRSYWSMVWLHILRYFGFVVLSTQTSFHNSPTQTTPKPEYSYMDNLTDSTQSNNKTSGSNYLSPNNATTALDHHWY